MGSTYKKIEIVGTSAKSFEDAVQNAIAAAGKSLEGLSWFEVVEQRGSIEGNKLMEYQVTVRIGFKVMES
jgi:flavin-binding protein dodecin